MKTNRRNVTPHPSSHLTSGEDGHLFFRLCHLCLHLNEADHEISQCEECTHVFKDEILTQFFDNDDSEAFSDENPEDMAEEEMSEEEGKTTKPLRDLNGLAVRF